MNNEHEQVEGTQGGEAKPMIQDVEHAHPEVKMIQDEAGAHPKKEGFWRRLYKRIVRK